MGKVERFRDEGKGEAVRGPRGRGGGGGKEKMYGGQGVRGRGPGAGEKSLAGRGRKEVGSDMPRNDEKEAKGYMVTNICVKM